MKKKSLSLFAGGTLTREVRVPVEMVDSSEDSVSEGEPGD